MAGAAAKGVLPYLPEYLWVVGEEHCETTLFVEVCLFFERVFYVVEVLEKRVCWDVFLVFIFAEMFLETV